MVEDEHVKKWALNNRLQDQGYSLAAADAHGDQPVLLACPAQRIDASQCQDGSGGTQRDELLH